MPLGPCGGLGVAGREETALSRTVKVLLLWVRSQSRTQGGTAGVVLSPSWQRWERLALSCRTQP